MPDLLTVAQAAHYLGVSYRTVLNYIHDGRIGAARLGPRNFRVPSSEVERLLEPIRRVSGPAADVCTGGGI